jgi:hypothetical protein
MIKACELSASHENSSPYDSSAHTAQSTDQAILASLTPTAPSTSTKTPSSHAETQQYGEPRLERIDGPQSEWVDPVKV